MSQSSVSAQSALRRLEQRQQLQAKRKKAPTGAMQQPAISNFLGGAVPEQKKQRIAEKEYDGIRSVRCVGCGTAVRTSNARKNYVSLAASVTSKSRNAQPMEKRRLPVAQVTKIHY
jgi:hypothetical protein